MPRKSRRDSADAIAHGPIPENEAFELADHTVGERERGPQPQRSSVADRELGRADGGPRVSSASPRVLRRGGRHCDGVCLSPSTIMSRQHSDMFSIPHSLVELLCDRFPGFELKLKV